MTRARTKKIIPPKNKGIKSSARAVASPPNSTNNENIALNSTTSTENSALNPAPIISADKNPDTTITEAPALDHPGPVIADALSAYDDATDNSATTTENSVLINPTRTIAGAALTCDTGNTTENPAPPTSAEATSNLSTSDMGATSTEKAALPTPQVTNPVPASETEDQAPIMEPTINNSPATSSIQNADTATERNEPAMPIQDEDAHFEFDDETPLNTIKRVDAPVPPSAFSESTETPSDASQADRSLLESAIPVSEDQLAKTDQERLKWLIHELCEMVGKRRKYKAEVKDLEKRMAIASNGETIVVGDSGSSICQPIEIDLTLGKYDRPTTIKHFQKTRFAYLKNLDVLVDRLSAHIRRPVDDDESANYGESGEEGSGEKDGNGDDAQVTAGSKRSLDDFLSDELIENRRTGNIVSEMVSEIQQLRMALKHE